MFRLVDITVEEFSFPPDDKCYYLTGTTHYQPPPGDDSPESLIHTDSYPTEADAITAAELWGKQLLNDSIAREVVIFVGGTDFKIMTRGQNP